MDACSLAGVSAGFAFCVVRRPVQRDATPSVPSAARQFESNSVPGRSRRMAEVTNKPTVSATQNAQQATTTTQQKKKAPGLSFKRYFSKAGISPYDEIEWERRTASITDSKGNSIFEQKD